MRVYLYIFFIMSMCSATSVFESDEEEKKEAEEHRIKFLQQLVKAKTVLLQDYNLVTRHVAIDVYQYRNYRSVSVIFFPIPNDVVDAQFTFLAEELHLNNIGSCKPKEVVVKIKYGSYPAVNPDGYDFPKHFIDPFVRERIHSVELTSKGNNVTYCIPYPKPGNWYAIVYVKWEDPRTEIIEQQGLSASCRTSLYADLQIKKVEDILIENCDDRVHINFTDVPMRFKCMSRDDPQTMTLNVSVSNVRSNIPEGYAMFEFSVASLNFPTHDHFIIRCIFDSTKEHEISFAPYPSDWHYIEIKYVQPGNTSQTPDCESYRLRTEEDISQLKVQDLMRDDKGKFFTFDYGLPTEDLSDVTSLVNLTSKEVKTLRFKINEFIDTGGNLMIEASILMSLKYYMGYKREVHKDGLVAFSSDQPFYKVVVCASIEYATLPLEDGVCKFNDNLTPALYVLNSTDSDSIYDKVIIPYPDVGEWYVTIRLFCDDTVCPCTTSDNGRKYYVDLNDDRDDFDKNLRESNGTWNGGRVCNATLVLAISSSSCLGGTCSNKGSCLLNTVGGFMMSFCSCLTGHGGWDCSDISRMDSQVFMMTSVLLLTLSNLAFIFSIYVGVIRRYYLEALMYTFAMIFSTMYHACDAPEDVSYCIFKIDLLQYGDFYSGIMSFWVTLLAMCVIPHHFKSTLQVAGATMVALLTKWNMHALFAFILPVVLGVALVFLTWFIDYRKLRGFRYPKIYYTVYFPAGLVLVGIGLVCFAFLQTEKNYKFVHSAWHILVALCVVFFLPDVKRGDGVNPFLPKSGFRNCFQKMLFCRRFRSHTSTPETVTE